MIKWLKNRTKQEKWMLAIIAALLVGVIVRWGFIKKEAGDAVRERVEYFKKSADPLPDPDTLPAADSSGWNAVRDSANL